MLVISKIKISLVSIEKSLYKCHLPYTRRVSSHRVLYLKFFSTYNICIVYLHLIEVGLKVTIAMLYFCHWKIPSDIMKNIFNFISIYSWKYSLITNMRNKRFTRKKNLYCFDIIKNCHIFGREMGNFRTCKELRLQKPIKFRLPG